LGRSSPHERSCREEPSRGELTSARPLARDISTGRVLERGRCHPQLRAAIERSWSRDRLHRRATAGEVMRGSGHPWSCSRDRIDCRSRQAARGPSRPRAKSPRNTSNGSSHSARERRRGERAPEAGSSVAKPRDRWRVPSKPVEVREHSGLGAPVDGRRFGSGKSSSLTRGRRKRSWLLASVRSSTPDGYGARQGASEVGRQPCAWSKTPRQGGPPVPGEARHPASREASWGRARIGRSWRRAVKRGPAGVGLPQGGPASHGRTRPSPVGEASCDQRSASCAPGSRAIHGCSCRGSIAEVGEKHLLRSGRGEPRGKPRRSGVARSGEASRRDAPSASGERVRGLSRERNREREGLRSIARSRIEPTEGTLGSRPASPLTGWRRTGSWRRGVQRLLTKDGSRGGERERGDLAVAPTGRQRVSEVAASGGGSPSRRAQGVCSHRERSVVVSRMRGTTARDDSRAAPDELQPKLPRRKTVASGDGSGSANCTTRPEEVDAVRRCHVAPQAQREGFASVE
jgi:hypothetical protein